MPASLRMDEFGDDRNDQFAGAYATTIIVDNSLAGKINGGSGAEFKRKWTEMLSAEERYKSNVRHKPEHGKWVRGMEEPVRKPSFWRRLRSAFQGHPN
jgi:hypothetical protein